MSRVNIVKRIKSDGQWKMLSIPRNSKGNYDWNALPDGRYYVEWYMGGGTRRRASAGVTTAQALEAQRRKRHELEGRKLGVPGFETAGETEEATPPRCHREISGPDRRAEKPNTHRKYEAVLNRFGEFFRDTVSIDAISDDDLTRFVVALKKITSWVPIRSFTMP